MLRKSLRLHLIVILIFLMIGLFDYSGFNCFAETAIIKILSANATSSSEDSLPITYLLDNSREGYWKPKTLDSGTNEGLFFEFQDPSLIDRIEIKVKKGAKGFAIDYYMDGKKNVLKNQTKTTNKNENSSNDQMAYGIENIDKNGDRLFILGAKKWYSKENLGPFNIAVKSFFIRITSAVPDAAIVSVRFYRKENKEPLMINVPVYVKGKVNATSTLNPETAYNVRNLFDSRVDFAWSIDGSKTSGIGESINISLDNPKNLSGLMIWNGYQRSDTHYYANSRPSLLKVVINDSLEFPVKLQDKMGSQLVLFPSIAKNVKKISLVTDGVFLGKSYKDMVISELRLVDDNNNAIILDTPALNIDLKNTKIQGMANLTLEPFMLGIFMKDTKIQEWYSNTYEASYEYPHKSIRFRSNGSFVCYAKDGQIMEGNWEPTTNGVRIFGKKYTTTTNYYNSIYLQEMKEKTAVKIFQENITVFNLANSSYEQVKKCFKTILADRHFYQNYTGKNGPIVWWIGLKPFGEVKITAANTEQLMKKLYDFGVAHKAVLLDSPLFTDLFLPGDQIQQTYYWDGMI